MTSAALVVDAAEVGRGVRLSSDTSLSIICCFFEPPPNFMPLATFGASGSGVGVAIL